MSDTITGMFAGFVREGGMPLVSDRYMHADITLTGVQSRGGITHTRGLTRPGTTADSFTMAGISNPVVSGTMPQSRTSFNGGFCVFYEFEGTRAFVEFEGSTRIRYNAFREDAMTRVDTGILFSDIVITGWRGRGIVREAPAILVPITDDLADIAASITGQRSLMDALNDGVRDAITEGTVVSTISSWVSRLDYCINPNSRYLLISIAIIDLSH